MSEEDDMDAEMEQRIFDMKDIDKMENFVDNQVLKGVQIPTKEKTETKNGTYRLFQSFISRNMTTRNEKA